MTPILGGTKPALTIGKKRARDGFSRPRCNGLVFEEKCKPGAIPLAQPAFVRFIHRHAR